MEFIETPTFTRMVTALLSDDEYRKMQTDLLEYPDRGDLVKGEVVFANFVMLCQDEVKVVEFGSFTIGYRTDI